MGPPLPAIRYVYKGLAIVLPHVVDGTRQHFLRSIAGRLVLVLIAVYLLITVVLTALQVGAEYYITKRSVHDELKNMGMAVSNGLAAAIFNVDDEQVDSILSGMAASSSIQAVLVKRQFQPDIVISRSSSFATREGDSGPFRDSDFSFTIPLEYQTLEGGVVTVGSLTLLSSSEIVFGKLRNGIVSILASSAIKLLCVCLVILLLSNRMVSRPLRDLTRAVTQISMETLHTERVDVGAGGPNELRTLKNAFNAMLDRLGEHRTARIQAEEKYRGIYQHAVEGIFQATPEGRFVEVNPAMSGILGYADPETLLAAAWEPDYALFASAEEQQRLLDILQRQENVTGFETRIYRKDGSVIWMSLNARSIFAPGGALELIEGMGTDITERKEAEAALRQAKEAAEATSRLKSDFISMVSHELRTPMTSVLGFAQMIRKKLATAIWPKLPADDPAVAKARDQVASNLNIIICEGNRLSLLISDVLDLSRMESGTMALTRKPLDISQALDTAMASVVVLFEEKGLTFTKLEDPDLPLVDADEDRIVQVYINLLANAVKFTESGGVTCRFDHTDTHVRVSIQDTGSGILPEDQECIFDKFKQLGDTLTGRPRGSGLGLAICKEIVNQHGGEIHVESSVGKGSTFVFTLPARASLESRTGLPESQLS